MTDGFKTKYYSPLFRGDPKNHPPVPELSKKAEESFERFGQHILLEEEELYRCTSLFFPGWPQFFHYGFGSLTDIGFDDLMLRYKPSRDVKLLETSWIDKFGNVESHLPEICESFGIEMGEFEDDIAVKDDRERRDKLFKALAKEGIEGLIGPLGIDLSLLEVIIIKPMDLLVPQSYVIAQDFELAKSSIKGEKKHVKRARI